MPPARDGGVCSPRSYSFRPDSMTTAQLAAVSDQCCEPAPDVRTMPRPAMPTPVAVDSGVGLHHSMSPRGTGQGQGGAHGGRVTWRPCAGSPANCTERFTWDLALPLGSRQTPARDHPEFDIAAPKYVTCRATAQAVPAMTPRPTRRTGLRGISKSSPAKAPSASAAIMPVNQMSRLSGSTVALRMAAPTETATTVRKAVQAPIAKGFRRG
jgi:hypothetical protein